jgi:hypothetical protein
MPSDGRLPGNRGADTITLLRPLSAVSWQAKTKTQGRCSLPDSGSLLIPDTDTGGENALG